jgi:hypothetical protein
LIEHYGDECGIPTEFDCVSEPGNESQRTKVKRVNAGVDARNISPSRI